MASNVDLFLMTPPWYSMASFAMILEFSVLEFVLLQALVLVVSTAVGIVAFGFAMAMTPFFLIFLEPRLVVEMNLMLTGVLFLVMSARSWGHVDRGLLGALVVGGAIGLPAGVALVSNVEGKALSLMLASVVIVTAVMAVTRTFPTFRRERVAAVPVGAVFNFLNAGLALGGPVMALFALNQRWGKDKTRAMLASFFLVTAATTLGAHAAFGLLGVEEVKSAAVFMPALLAGTLVAHRFIGRIDEEAFRRLVMATLLATSAGVLAREVWGMV